MMCYVLSDYHFKPFTRSSKLSTVDKIVLFKQRLNAVCQSAHRERKYRHFDQSRTTAASRSSVFLATGSIAMCTPLCQRVAMTASGQH